MLFVTATPQNDDIVIQHYLPMWESYATPAKHLKPDCRFTANLGSKAAR